MTAGSRRARRWARRWRVPLLILTSSLVGLTLLAYSFSSAPSSAALPPYGGPPATSYAVIEGSDLIFSYTTSGGNFTAYLTPAPECDACPIHATPGTAWTFFFNVTDNSSVAHSISAIQVGSPFTLHSVSPSLPVRITGHATISFELRLGTPPQPGYYFLSGSIDSN